MHDGREKWHNLLPACCLQKSLITSFCRLVLESDDATSAQCEMLQDFVKEPGSSEKVEAIVRSRLQEIRGTDFLIAWLCHLSLELQNGILSEMNKFGVPPDPFEVDGIVAKLKEIVAEYRHSEWYTRAAAILLVVQIAQMDYCQKGTVRNDTLRWVLEMLGSDTHEDTHFAIVLSLGTCLKGVGNDIVGADCIRLASQDEQQLFGFLNRTLNMKEPKERSILALLEALADVEAYSEGLVDWVVGNSLIETGQWPLRHVLLLCKQTTDSVRVTHVCKQLLGRVHALSIEEFHTEDDKSLTGLKKMLAVIRPTGPSVMLPFLEKGKAHPRTILLRVAVDLKIPFVRLHLVDLARCLLLEAGDDQTDKNLLTNFFQHEYAMYQSALEHTDLVEVSSTFQYLQNAMAEAISDDGTLHQVAKELKDFEVKVADGTRERKREQERERERCRQRDQDRQGTESEQDVECGGKPEQESKQELREETKQKEEDPSLEKLAVAVKTFRPTMLKSCRPDPANPDHLYCATKLWEISGLIQRDEIGKYFLVRLFPLLSDSQSVVARDSVNTAEDAFKSMMVLKGPWMTGYGQKDGRWEQAVCNTMRDHQDNTLVTQ